MTPARQSAAQKAAPSPLRAEQNVDDAIAGILRNTLDQVLANREAAEDPSDVEGVHQMRVGLRRLRAAIKFLKHDVPSHRLERFDLQAEQLADTLAPVRSIDALNEQIEQAAKDGRCDYAPLRQAAAARRRQVQGILRIRLRDPRTTIALSEIGQWIARHGWRDQKSELLDAPARKLAEQVLGRLERKARKRGRNLAKLAPRGRHKFRLALKALRYAAKLFAPLYEGDKTERYLKRIAKLLDALGADHDNVMLPATLNQIGSAASNPAARRAVKALIDQRRAGRAALRKQLRKRRRRWKKAAVFW